MANGMGRTINDNLGTLCPKNINENKANTENIGGLGKKNKRENDFPS